MFVFLMSETFCFCAPRDSQRSRFIEASFAAAGSLMRPENRNYIFLLQREKPIHFFTRRALWCTRILKPACRLSTVSNLPHEISLRWDLTVIQQGSREIKIHSRDTLAKICRSGCKRYCLYMSILLAEPIGGDLLDLFSEPAFRETGRIRMFFVLDFLAQLRSLVLEIWQTEFDYFTSVSALVRSSRKTCIP